MVYDQLVQDNLAEIFDKNNDLLNLMEYDAWKALPDKILQIKDYFYSFNHLYKKEVSF